jgi:hypothetical protein
VGSNLSQNIDGNGQHLKPCQAPNSGSFVEKNTKNIGSQMGQTDKKTFKKKIVFL